MSEEKLNALESKVTALKEEKIRTETELKGLREQKAKVTAELEALGVAPKDLNVAITEMEANIQSQLTEIDEQIPKEIS